MIDFNRIRAHDGSQERGFEELCCQLAHEEPRPPGAPFIRTGRGADAGVECYTRLTDGGECGWQAKYVDSWKRAQPQLDDSLKSALANRPALNRFVVCLPFDLPDGRRAGVTTQREHFDQWREDKCAEAAGEGRNLDIVLWDQSELTRRLLADSPVSVGRRRYWFDDAVFSSEEFEARFQRARKNLGKRYTPESHIDLDLGVVLQMFCRDEVLWEKLGQLAQGLERHAAFAMRQPCLCDLSYDALTAAVGALVASVRVFAVERSVVAPFPLERWSQLAKRVDAELDVLKAQDTIDPGTRNPRFEEFAAALVLFHVELASPSWEKASSRAAIVVGPGGIGKSHLVANLARERLDRHLPTVLILGDSLPSIGDPWRAILEMLDIPACENVDEMLGALDTAAETRDGTALVIVDAINEGVAATTWRGRLAGFLSDAARFEHVRVLLTCKDTYLPMLLTDDSSSDGLARIEHEGFAQNGYAAASDYLRRRGFRMQSTPFPAPECANPLFLSTCCDVAESMGERVLPDGSTGIRALFDHYHRAVTSQITDRLCLDADLLLVEDGLTRFTDAVADTPDQRLDYPIAYRLFEEVHSSGGLAERSLLRQLVLESVLTVETVETPGAEPVHRRVRFTFERVAEHRRAERLLEDHVQGDDVRAAFAPGSTLHELIIGSDRWDMHGVIEAMATRLAERWQVELPDLGPPAESDAGMVWRHAVAPPFASSLRTRARSALSERTWILASQLLPADNYAEALLALCTEPGNMRNIEYIDRRLTSLSMPERDSLWAVRLATQPGLRETAQELVDWALSLGIEQLRHDDEPDSERVRLTTLALTWFLDTSVRRLRDRATKALAALLARRLRLAAELVRRFASVPAPYAWERLLAAVYGAVLQDRDRDGLPDLCHAVHNAVYRDGAPRPGVLVHDHTSSLLLRASHVGCLPAEIDRTTLLDGFPPAQVERVPEELIADYTGATSSDRRPDIIAWSTGAHGDFGRKIISYQIGPWSATSLMRSEQPESVRERYLDWLTRFEASATESQRNAFATATGAARAREHRGQRGELTRDEPLHEAITTFRETLDGPARDEFDTEAAEAVRHWPTKPSEMVPLVFFESLDGSPDQDDDVGDRSLPPDLNELYRSDSAVASRLDRFDRAWGQRFVCLEAHRLGWTAERFDGHDRHLRRVDGDSHGCERIGKKYQWLALDTLGALLRDGYHYLGHSSRPDGSTLPVFDPADDGWRDTDPSLLLSSTGSDAWRNWERTWWAPSEVKLEPTCAAERVEWFDDDEVRLASPSLIQVVDPEDRRNWLVLQQSSRWTGEDAAAEGLESLAREISCAVKCLVVASENVAQLVRRYRNEGLTLGSGESATESLSDRYLGEIDWHPAVVSAGDWRKVGEHDLGVRETALRYTRAAGSYDHGVNQSVSLWVPAPWLCSELALSLRDGTSACYTDAEGVVQWQDPSAHHDGPDAALVGRERFVDHFVRSAMEPVWIVQEHQTIYNTEGGMPSFRAERKRTTIYRLSDSVIVKVADWVSVEDAR